MSKESEILGRAAHRDGMTVPEGYFDEFASRMSAMLPDRPELAAPVVAPRSLWQRVRPYVYMAAMFAGVWCMLKMFAIMTGGPVQPLETNTIMAEAMGNDAFVNQYVIDDLNQWDLYDEMMVDGVDPAALADSLVFDTITD